MAFNHASYSAIEIKFKWQPWLNVNYLLKIYESSCINFFFETDLDGRLILVGAFPKILMS